ncbi:hypothetical protein O0L34_g9255 [Tuta absoluta]|nr:hypothetical protein O0L34_g9255 [Tuta absoluta]
MEEAYASDRDSMRMDSDIDAQIPCGQQSPGGLSAISMSAFSVGGNKRSCVDSLDEDGYETVTNRKKVLKKRKFLKELDTKLESTLNSVEVPKNIRINSNAKETATPSYFEVSVSATKELPKPMAFAKLLNSENIKNALQIVRKSPFKIQIRFGAIDEAQALLNNAKFAELGYKCQLTYGGDVTFSYGIIKGVDLDLHEEDISKLLECDFKITSVKRLRRLDESGKWVPCETIRVCFLSAVLPTYVYAYGCRFKVWRNVFPVTQCRGCWKFGHFFKYCPLKKMLCPKCGGEHDNCTKINIKCLNCKGNHLVLDKSCPIFQKEKAIKEIMSYENITYKCAYELYRQNYNPTPEPNETQQYQIELQGTSHTIEEERSVAPNTSNITMDSYASRAKLETKTKEKRKLHYSKITSHSKTTDPTHSQIISHPKIEKKKETLKKNNENTEKLDLKRLLLKLKDIYVSEASFEQKLMAVVKAIFIEVKEVVCSFLSNGDLMEVFFKLLNG